MTEGLETKQEVLNLDNFVNSATGNEHLILTPEQKLAQLNLEDKEREIQQREENLKHDEKGAAAIQEAAEKIQNEGAEEEGSEDIDDVDTNWLKDVFKAPAPPPAETAEEKTARELKEKTEKEEKEKSGAAANTTEPDYTELSKELGIEFKDKTQFINDLKTKMTQVKVETSEPIAAIDKLISLAPRERIKEWAKLELGKDEAAAEEYIQRIEKQGDDFLSLKDDEIVSSLNKDRGLLLREIQSKQTNESAQTQKITNLISTQINGLETVRGIPVKDMQTEIAKFHQSFLDAGVKGFGVYSQKQLEDKFITENFDAIMLKVASAAAARATKASGQKFYKDVVLGKLLNKQVAKPVGGKSAVKKDGTLDVDAWLDAASNVGGNPS